MVASGACLNTPPILTQLVDAHHVASGLRVAFLEASGAADRAVLAETDEASQADAQESELAVQTVDRAMGDLEPLLKALGYDAELKTLEQFRGRFEEFRRLNGEILLLAVENSNVKAERLAFGPAQEAADAMAAALAMAAGSAHSAAVDAQVGSARAAVLEIQVLQSRHIAEVDETRMTVLEQRMSAAADDARSRIARLRTLLGESGPQQLAAASDAFERFMGVNRNLVALSRRNSNVRSLALTLGRKRVVAAECLDQLRVLEENLARHGSQATR